MDPRCVFVTFKSPILVGIESFRKRYDPLWDKIPAHITLIHPFQDPLLDDGLIRHVESFLEIEAREISFGHVVFEGGYVYLPMLIGAASMRSARDRLYSGLLAKHRSLEHPYIPHVTIGRYRSHSEIESLSIEAANFPGEVPGKLDQVAIEAIGEDSLSRNIWRRALD